MFSPPSHQLCLDLIHRQETSRARGVACAALDASNVIDARPSVDHLDGPGRAASGTGAAAHTERILDDLGVQVAAAVVTAGLIRHERLEVLGVAGHCRYAEIVDDFRRWRAARYVCVDLDEPVDGHE